MAVSLEQGEKVIKEWEYGKSKGWFLTKAEYKIIVTNKRVIRVSEGGNIFDCKSVPIANIKAVDAEYSQVRIGILKAICTLGLAFRFRRAQLSLEFNVVGAPYSITSRQTAGAGILARIPIFGLIWSFIAGGTYNEVKKVKVYNDVAREICEKLPTLIQSLNVKTVET